MVNCTKLGENRDPTKRAEVDQIREWLDEDGNLQKSRMLSWLHRQLDIVFSQFERLYTSVFKLPIEGHLYNISRSRSGPAQTINVTVLNSYTPKFSIDLVASLSLEAPLHWVCKEPFNERDWPKTWQAIPRPDQGTLQGDKEWTTSYADIERHLIKDRHKLKNLIRFFKVGLII